jgi:hypothetical protein
LIAFGPVDLADLDLRRCQSPGADQAAQERGRHVAGTDESDPLVFHARRIPPGAQLGKFGGKFEARSLRICTVWLVRRTRGG